VSVARVLIASFAERERAPEIVRSVLTLAMTEACSNVVMNAYLDARPAVIAQLTDALKSSTAVTAPA
jgi:anti-sigma regulatory factor (Ser/Thr protein kinase)